MGIHPEWVVSQDAILWIHHNKKDNSDFRGLIALTTLLTSLGR